MQYVLEFLSQYLGPLLELCKNWGITKSERTFENVGLKYLSQGHTQWISVQTRITTQISWLLCSDLLCAKLIINLSNCYCKLIWWTGKQMYMMDKRIIDEAGEKKMKITKSKIFLFFWNADSWGDGVWKQIFLLVYILQAVNILNYLYQPSSTLGLKAKSIFKSDVNTRFTEEF